MYDNLFALMVFVLGLVIGSFLNVVAYRLPRGESIVLPPSRCPRCGRRLTPLELIPVLSWLFQRGKCRGCRQPIHWQYPVVELVTGLLFAWMAWRYGFTWETLVGLVLVGFLIPLSVIDLRTMLLPDRLTFPLFAVMLVLRLWIGEHPWWWYLMGGFLGAGMLLVLYWLSPILFGREGMGLGDVKLMAGIGTAVGLYEAVLALFMASVIGVVFGLAYRLAWGRHRGSEDEERGAFPFGPSLAAGGLLAFLYGEDIWQIYLSFLS